MSALFPLLRSPWHFAGPFSVRETLPCNSQGLVSNGTHQTHVFPAPVTDSSRSGWVTAEGLLLLSSRCLGAGISLIILCYYSIFLRVALVCSLALTQILLQAVPALHSLPWLGNARGHRAAAHQGRDRGTARLAFCNPVMQILALVPEIFLFCIS